MDIQTIHDELNTEVIKWCTKAEQLFNIRCEVPKIRLHLKGATAGQAFYKKNGLIMWELHFNQQLYINNREYMLQTTVPHELAHLIAHRMNDINNQSRGYFQSIMPHGREWQRIMLKFGVTPNRCHKLNTEGLVNRRDRPFAYKCNCPDLMYVTQTLHERAQHGYWSRKKGRLVKPNYTCVKCGQKIVHVWPTD